MTIKTSSGLERDKGPQKIYQFLSRTGFLQVAGDRGRFSEWMENLSFEEFEKHLFRLNGLVREMSIKERGKDDEGVSVKNQFDDISYLPPRKGDKRALLEKSFTAAKTLPEKDAGLLLYYTLQAVHPFGDGNGRTGRLLYMILEKGELGERLTSQELSDFLAHDGESGPGRQKFTQKVRSPEEVYRAVEQLFAADVLGKNITSKFKRIYSGLQSGTIESVENNNLSSDLKQELERLMSEGGGGAYPFRNIILLKYLQSRDQLEKYGTEDEQQELLRFDGQKLLEGLSESDASEIIEMDLGLKQTFVEKLIDIIANAEKYQMAKGGTLKDHFYLEP